MKKILTTILALVIIAANISFAACNNDSGGAGSSNVPPAGSGEIEETEGDPYDKIANSYEESLNVDLDELDYGNKKLTVYHSITTYPEFNVDSMDSQMGILSEAVYKRDEYTQENLGIKLDYIERNGNFGDKSPFMRELKTIIDDPENQVGIIAVPSQTAPYLHSMGVMKELTAYEWELDLGKAWWPGNVRNENKMAGRIYYVTGDLSPALMKVMNAVFVNKKMASDLGYNTDNSLIDTVKSGDWTIDEMIGMTAGVYSDLDEVSGKSAGDTFGLALHGEYGTDALWTGMGYRYVDVSTADNVLYILSEDYISASPFVTRMSEWWNTTDVFNESYGVRVETSVEAFSRSGALFLCHRIGNVDPEICDFDFTVLPLPKLDLDQTEYHTAVGAKFFLYSICSAYDDTELAAQVLQTMGFYGYHLTTPAVALELFGEKSNMNKDDEEMFNLIRNSITLDSGKIISTYSNSDIVSNLHNSVTYSNDWGAMSPADLIVAGNRIEKAGSEIVKEAVKNDN